MNKSWNTPVALGALLALVFTLIILNSLYLWYQNTYVVVTHTYTPNSKQKLNSDRDHYYPNQLEAKALLINEALPHQQEDPTPSMGSDQLNMKEFMSYAVIRESAHSISETRPFLVIAGVYTDDTYVISKQAQLQGLGLSAEIVQFDQSPYKNLCVGRYQNREDAEVLATKLESVHEINTYVYNKHPK